jgi:hypothetical protein
VRLSFRPGPGRHPDHRAEVAVRQSQAARPGASVVDDHVWLATDRLTTPLDSATPAKTAPEPQEVMVSAVIPVNVGHALFAVVAQGRIVVVGQQPDQVIGTVPGWGNQPEGGAAGTGIVQDSLLD